MTIQPLIYDAGDYVKKLYAERDALVNLLGWDRESIRDIDRLTIPETEDLVKRLRECKDAHKLNSQALSNDQDERKEREAVIRAIGLDENDLLFTMSEEELRKLGKEYSESREKSYNYNRQALLSEVEKTGKGAIEIKHIPIEEIHKAANYKEFTPCPEYKEYLRKLTDSPSGYERVNGDAPFDPVNRPVHYNSHPSGVECITITRHMPFNIGNAIKYLWRSEHKNGKHDLEKAIFYIKDEILRLYGKDLQE